MQKRCVLTTGELQLVQAILGKERICGLEEYSLTEESVFGTKERDSLVLKQILSEKTGGKYELDEAAGFAFMEISQAETWLSAYMLFRDGRCARINLYFVKDLFWMVRQIRKNEIEFLALPTYPLAMGGLINALNQWKKIWENANGSAERFQYGSKDTLPLMRELVSGMPGSEPSDGIMHLVWSGKEDEKHSHTYAVRAEGFSTIQPGFPQPQEEQKPLHELVELLSKEIYRVHQNKVKEAAEK